MTRLSSIATDIYRDQARGFGYALVRNSPHLRAIVENIVPGPLGPLPDSAALLVAARLLHDLVTIRRHLAFNSGSAWALVETYLLMNDFTIKAQNDDISSLLESFIEGRLDAASTFRFLAANTEPSDRA